MNMEDRDAVQRILNERARKLARRPPQEETGDYAQVVVFLLGEEKYGLDIDNVNEVREVERITPIPGLPPLWAGMVNLRGSLYPVLDLKRFIRGGFRKPSITKGEDREGKKEKESETSAKIMLVSAQDLQVCLLIEEVIEVRRVLVDNLEQPTEEGSPNQRQMIQGITPDFLTIIDIEQVFSAPELVVDFNGI